MFQDNYCLPQSPAALKRQSACTVLKLLNLTVCSRNVLLSVIMSPGSETHLLRLSTEARTTLPLIISFFFTLKKMQSVHVFWQFMRT